MVLENILHERASISKSITESVNRVCSDWGLECVRFEIRDISPPQKVVLSMVEQATSQREKQVKIIKAEAEKETLIVMADGKKKARIMESEAEKAEKLNLNQVECQSILSLALATSDALSRLAKITREPGVSEAITLKLAEQYIEAFSKLAQTNNSTLVLPNNSNDLASMIGQTMQIYKGLEKAGLQSK